MWSANKMKNYASLAASFTLFILSVSSASSAPCQTLGGQFFVDQNDSVAFSTTTNSAGCDHVYRAGGTLALESATIVSRPKNGNLTQSGALSFTYKPKSGFVGTDTYVVRVCGSNRSGKGCSTLNYTTNVQ
jgi:hypothetical protein